MDDHVAVTTLPAAMKVRMFGMVGRSADGQGLAPVSIKQPLNCMVKIPLYRVAAL